MFPTRITNALLAVLLSLHLCAQKLSPEIESRIKKVENNLATWVQVDGIPNWNIRERMRFYHTNGVSIAVIKDFKLDWAKGYGMADTSGKKKVNETTLFQAASASKSVAALGILKLIQEGKIDPAKDINEYLTSWQFPYDSVAKGKKITVENLLNHTAGVSPQGFPGYSKQDTLPTLVQILDGTKPAHNPKIHSVIEPGFRSDYSGGGYAIAQLLVQDVTGMSFDAYMQKSVLEPLGMAQSSFAEPTAINVKSRAAGYYESGAQVKGKYKIYPEVASGGMWSTPSDLAKYIIEMQLSIQGRSNKILSKEMAQHGFVTFDSTAALGNFVINRSGAKYFAHGGGNEGFICQFFGSMENGNGVVVMTNGTTKALVDEICNSVAQVYNWTNFYRPEKRNTIRPTADSLEKFAGFYMLGKNLIEVSRKADKLYMTLGANPCELHFTDKDHFFLFEWHQSNFSFVYNKKGEANGFQISEKNIARRVNLKQ